jgi:hypothetical protein
MEMTQAQAKFFRGTILPIIREIAEDREDPGRERNPLRPMLRRLLTYIEALEQQLAEARESRDRAVEASNVDLEKWREAEAQLATWTRKVSDALQP